MPDVGPFGPVAEAPGRPGSLLVSLRQGVGVYDAEKQKVSAEKELPSAVLAVATDSTAGMVYLVLADGSLWSCRVGRAGQLTIGKIATAFGPCDRGCLLLPRSRRLVGIAADGTVSVFEPEKGIVAKVKGPVPLPAGPAAHPTEDVWYFADRHVLQYALPASPKR
jgi:hypothetical protein